MAESQGSSFSECCWRHFSAWKGVLGLGVRVWGLGSRVSGFREGLGSKVYGLGFRV